MSDLARQIEEAKRAAAQSPAPPSRFGLGKLVRWIALGAGVVTFGATFIATLAAYFLFSVGRDGIVLDGFGRQVYEAPFLVRLVAVDHWRGLGWFLFDMVAFWSAIGVGFTLISFGLGRPRSR